MIHYHGTPITPRTVLNELAGRHFCVSFAAPDDVERCHQIGQSVMLDNGAFTTWRQGHEFDRAGFYVWAEPWLDYPTTWAVIPDLIEGSEGENDRFIAEWGLIRLPRGAPVWHLHESFDRLRRLSDKHERICFGSSGQFAQIGSDAWHRRVTTAFNVLDQRNKRLPWVHMLRGMALAGTHYPFASVDSTDIARNHNRQQNTARKLADRWDGLQCPARWDPTGEWQTGLRLAGEAV